MDSGYRPSVTLLLAIALTAALPPTKANPPSTTQPLPVPKTPQVSGPELPSGSLEGCKQGTPLYVQAGASAGDGRAASPFGTLGEALAYASKVGWCEADLRVATGTYAESIVVDRHTVLRRWEVPATAIVSKDKSSKAKPSKVAKAVVLDGTIQSGGPYRIALERIVIANASGPAAIRSIHAKGETRLDHVTIRNAKQRGILHTRGKLFAKDVRIVGTARDDGDVTTGIAVMLTDGAVANLQSVKILHTRSQALTMRGKKTRVVAKNLEIRNVAWHPASAETVSEISLIPELPSGREAMGFGAILVDQGSFYADGLDIADVHFAGVFARREGRVRLRNARIRDTRRIEEVRPNGTEGAKWGGIAVAATGRATLDIADFEFLGNPWIGVHLHQSKGSIRDGSISDAVTGIGTADISFPGYDPADCVERVELIRVERSLGAFVREVPQPGSSLDEELNPSSDELPSSCPSIAAP